MLTKNHVNRVIIQNRPKVELTQMPSNSRKNKSNVAYSHNAIQYSNENEISATEDNDIYESKKYNTK